METARGLGELLKTGWRPKRTIILASWDGEEWGLLGSTEWVEKHADGARDEGGRLHQQRQHRQGLAERRAARIRCRRSSTTSMRDVPDPQADGTSAVRGEAAIARSARPKTDAEKRDARASGSDFPIDALGSGSDYTAFLDHLTIASLEHGLRRRRRRRRLSLDLRLVLLVHALLRRATSPTARRCRGRSARRSCGWPTPTSCRSSSPRRRATLRGYVDEIDKLRDGARRTRRRST